MSLLAWSAVALMAGSWSAPAPLPGTAHATTLFAAGRSFYGWSEPHRGLLLALGSRTVRVPGSLHAGTPQVAVNTRGDIVVAWVVNDRSRVDEVMSLGPIVCCERVHAATWSAVSRRWTSSRPLERQSLGSSPMVGIDRHGLATVIHSEAPDSFGLVPARVFTQIDARSGERGSVAREPVAANEYLPPPASFTEAADGRTALAVEAADGLHIRSGAAPLSLTTTRVLPLGPVAFTMTASGRVAAITRDGRHVIATDGTHSRVLARRSDYPGGAAVARAPDGTTVFAVEIDADIPGPSLRLAILRPGGHWKTRLVPVSRAGDLQAAAAPGGAGCVTWVTSAPIISCAPPGHGFQRRHAVGGRARVTGLLLSSTRRLRWSVRRRGLFEATARP